ncbi:MAG: hypothetical protein Q9205_005109 [Flavoplaca limonia]
MFYATFSHKRSAEGALLVFALAVFIATFVTAYYYHIKDPLFHQNAFALLTVVVFVKSLYGMEVSLRPSRQAKRRVEVGRADANDATEQARVDQRDRNIIETMYQMIPVGLGSIALGFLIWNLDNAFCPTLRQWRRAVEKESLSKANPQHFSFRSLLSWGPREGTRDALVSVEGQGTADPMREE